MIFTAKDNPHARYVLQLSKLNEMLKSDPSELISQTERYYRTQVEKTANGIHASQKHVVLLSGPSGSGKTTTADNLKKALSILGKAAHVVSLDDFFLGKGRYPKLSDGRDDYESVYALDLQLIRNTIADMLDGGHASLPRFDFSTSERIDGAYQLDVGENDVVIFEGIHALNPILLPESHEADAYKIYVSPKCQLFDGEQELISSKTLRLTRRMIRDCRYRNYLHQQTVAIWDNVIDGERKNITPFADSAESVIDTTHFYEYGLYCAQLNTVKSREGFEREEAVVREIKNIYDRISPISESVVPQTSMIREFIGKDE